MYHGPITRATFGIVMGLLRFKDAIRNYDEAVKLQVLCDWDLLRALGMASYEFFLSGVMLIYILKCRARLFEDVIVWSVICAIGFFLTIIAIVLDCLVCGTRWDELYYFLFWICYQVYHVYLVLRFVRAQARRDLIDREIDREQFEDPDTDPEPLYYAVPTYACEHSRRRFR